MTFGPSSIFAYRGKDKRVVVEMPASQRTLEKLEATQGAWATKNSRRKPATRTTEDQPLWSSLCSLLLSLSIHPLTLIIDHSRPPVNHCSFLSIHPHTLIIPARRFMWEDELMDAEEHRLSEQKAKDKASNPEGKKRASPTKTSKKAQPAKKKGSKASAGFEDVTS